MNDHWTHQNDKDDIKENVKYTFSDFYSSSLRELTCFGSSISVFLTYILSSLTVAMLVSIKLCLAISIVDQADSVCLASLRLGPPANDGVIQVHSM